jgi:hypothetical protein
MAVERTLDASPESVLRLMRGSIVDARRAYPDVLHVEVRDSDGDLWRLATQDADWSPLEPDELRGRSVEDADIDEATGELHLELSDGGLLDVRPTAHEALDDPPNWKLFTPSGWVLEFGPGKRWHFNRADEPIRHAWTGKSAELEVHDLDDFDRQTFLDRIEANAAAIRHASAELEVKTAAAMRAHAEFEAESAAVTRARAELSEKEALSQRVALLSTVAVGASFVGLVVATAALIVSSH